MTEEETPKDHFYERLNDIEHADMSMDQRLDEYAAAINEYVEAADINKGMENFVRDTATYDIIGSGLGAMPEEQVVEWTEELEEVEPDIVASARSDAEGQFEGMDDAEMHRNYWTAQTAFGKALLKRV